MFTDNLRLTGFEKQALVLIFVMEKKNLGVNLILKFVCKARPGLHVAIRDKLIFTIININACNKQGQLTNC